MALEDVHHFVASGIVLAVRAGGVEQVAVVDALVEERFGVEEIDGQVGDDRRRQLIELRWVGTVFGAKDGQRGSEAQQLLSCVVTILGRHCGI